MIINRQKLFFKGEKEMIEELKKDTNNFSHFPHSLRNQTAKDIVDSKLNNITDFMIGKLGGSYFNKEGEKIVHTFNKNLNDSDKEFLARIGLPKTAENLQRVVEKYTNDKAIERWKKMYPDRWEHLKDTSTKDNLKTILGIGVNHFRPKDNKNKELADWAKRMGVGIEKSERPLDSHYDIENNVVGMSKLLNNSSAVLAHELGHAWDFKKSIGKTKRNPGYLDVNNEKGEKYARLYAKLRLAHGLKSLSEENTASSKALAKLKQLNSKSLPAHRAELENAYNSYWRTFLSGGKEYLNSKFE